MKVIVTENLEGNGVVQLHRKREDLDLELVSASEEMDIDTAVDFAADVADFLGCKFEHLEERIKSKKVKDW